MTLSFLAVRDRQRLEQLARRERTTSEALARIAVHELLRASASWDGEDRRRVERRAMEAAPVIQSPTPATISRPERPRNRQGGGPWTPEQRARYEATIAAKQAQREPPPPVTTERPCKAACGQMVALHPGMGRQPEYCPTCKRQRAVDGNRQRRRAAVLDGIAKKVAASMQTAHPEPGASPEPGALSLEPVSHGETEPDAEPDLLVDESDADPFVDEEDLLEVPEFVPPKPARPRAEMKPLRHPKAAARASAPTGGSWWMTATPGEFTKTAALRVEEMSRSKGAKIASQMETVRREL